MSNPIDALHAQKLRWLRHHNGNIKQDHVAKALGITQQDYSDYELGKKHFSDDFIIRVCEYFKIRLEDFHVPNNGLAMGSNNSNSSHINHNDLKLVEAANQAYQIALKAKDETIQMLKEALEIERRKR